MQELANPRLQQIIKILCSPQPIPEIALAKCLDLYTFLPLHEQSNVLRGIARNATTRRVLLRVLDIALGFQDACRICVSIAGNPNISLEILKRIVNLDNKDPSLYYAIGSCHLINEEIVKNILMDPKLVWNSRRVFLLGLMSNPSGNQNLYKIALAERTINQALRPKLQSINQALRPQFQYISPEAMMQLSHREIQKYLESMSKEITDCSERNTLLYKDSTQESDICLFLGSNPEVPMSILLKVLYIIQNISNTDPCGFMKTFMNSYVMKLNAIQNIEEQEQYLIPLFKKFEHSYLQALVEPANLREANLRNLESMITNCLGKLNKEMYKIIPNLESIKPFQIFVKLIMEKLERTSYRFIEIMFQDLEKQPSSFVEISKQRGGDQERTI